jgi:hypothetical protein
MDDCHFSYIKNWIKKNPGTTYHHGLCCPQRGVLKRIKLTFPKWISHIKLINSTLWPIFLIPSIPQTCWLSGLQVMWILKVCPKNYEISNSQNWDCQKPLFFQCFIGLAQGKDIVFRFIIEYSSSLRDFGP